jgi:hypothetical protein
MTMEDYGGTISTGKTPDSSTRDLWKSYQQNHLVANEEERAKEMMNLSFKICFSYILSDFLHVNSYDLGPMALLPFWRRHLSIFIAVKIPSPLVWLRCFYECYDNLLPKMMISKNAQNQCGYWWCIFRQIFHVTIYSLLLLWHHRSLVLVRLY